MNLSVLACTVSKKYRMLFNREKYIGLVIALILLVLGFLLMSGPGNNQADQFDPRVFSFRRITLAPIILLLTYGGLIYLVMKKPKDKCSDEK